MKSRWVEADAERLVTHDAKAGAERELALRIYTTRLLGSDPKLVLHGGGNTSIKMRARDALGEELEVLRVKASGTDMATIEADGLPAVRLMPLRRLRSVETIADEELVAIERANLVDPAAPNPSVEVDAARLSAAPMRRPYPRRGGAQRHRPAGRRKEMRRRIRQPAGIRALPDAWLRTCQESD